MKLILLNGLIIAVVIWFAGVSVKDFACLVVGQFELVGEGNSHFFNRTMDIYFWRASILAVLVAILIHYVFTHNVLSPLKQLTKSTQLMIEGKSPELVAVKSDDEIGRLIRHFNELAQTLQRTEENQKRMLNHIAHELRTPLSNLNGYLEALCSGVLEGNRELYQSLFEESQYLARLVDQIHELSVWEAKKNHNLTLRKINIQDLIQRSIHSFQLESEKRGISLEVSIQEGVVIGEEDGIKQIMNNLLTNAFMYSTGNIIKITGRCEQSVYKITVSNKGEPIPKEVRELLFERFYRMDPARHRTPNQYGTGLGLSIVKEIVERLDGKAGLDTDGENHSFWVQIPNDQ